MGAGMSAATMTVDQKGVLDLRALPDDQFEGLWDHLYFSGELKERVVAQIILGLTARQHLDPAAVPLHGLIVLVGPPGTGKTSLAKACASKAASILRGQKVRYLQVEPHSLTSSSLGKSQREVKEFLFGTVAEYASSGPLIVLLDEVETIATNRTKLSMEANPIDVHRATDAVLAGLDHLSAKYPHLLFIATSNFSAAVDEALISRADLLEHVGLPDAAACREILKDTLSAMAQKWPGIKKLIGDGLGSLAPLAEGLDGRQIRKAVISACALERSVAIDPGKLEIMHLERAFKRAREVRK